MASAGGATTSAAAVPLKFVTVALPDLSALPEDARRALDGVLPALAPYSHPGEARAEEATGAEKASKASEPTVCIAGSFTLWLYLRAHHPGRWLNWVPGDADLFHIVPSSTPLAAAQREFGALCAQLLRLRGETWALRREGGYNSNRYALSSPDMDRAQLRPPVSIILARRPVDTVEALLAGFDIHVCRCALVRSGGVLSGVCGDAARRRGAGRDPGRRGSRDGPRCACAPCGALLEGAREIPHSHELPQVHAAGLYRHAKPVRAERLVDALRGLQLRRSSRNVVMNET